MRGLFIPERITPGNGNAWRQHDNVFTIDCVIFVPTLFIRPICVDLAYFFKFLLKFHMLNFLRCYLEKGMEYILKAAGSSLLSLHVEDCGPLISDRYSRRIRLTVTK